MIGIISSTFQNKHLFEDALQLPIVGGAGRVQHLILIIMLRVMSMIVMMFKTGTGVEVGAWGRCGVAGAEGRRLQLGPAIFEIMQFSKVCHMDLWNHYNHYNY